MKITDLPFVSKLREPNADGGASVPQLGTQTVTEVKGEQTDKDPSYSPEHLTVLGTETFTKASGEDTDKDPYSYFDPTGN